MNRITRYNKLIDQLIANLRLQEMLEGSDVELEPETVASLKTAPPLAANQKKTPPPPPPEPRRVASAPPVEAAGNQAQQLADIANDIRAFEGCALKAGAKQAVPGQGNPNPDIVFIGEAPGQEEDEQGLAFVGPSGQLLTRMIEAAGLRREDVWIGNIVKWRPPNNRPPTSEEIDACMPFLEKQLAILQPKVIVCLGGTAVKGLLKTSTGIMRLRGNWQDYKGIPVMPTYHPSFLLRKGPAQKKHRWEAWEDITQVLKKLGQPIPEKR